LYYLLKFWERFLNQCSVQVQLDRSTENLN
jgi:hypothetical protein